MWAAGGAIMVGATEAADAIAATMVAAEAAIPDTALVATVNMTIPQAVRGTAATA